MSEFTALIREYAEILDLEHQLSNRKNALKRLILQELTSRNVHFSQTEFGTAERKTRYTLKPRRDPVLELLDREDLFPFTQFTPNRVKEWLVPKYGRERLIPLFDIHKTEYLYVKRPGAAQSLGLT